MELRIYDKSGNPRAEICPDDNSTQQKSVMGDNTLVVSFTTWEAIAFDINDYVDYEGERYTLLSVPCPSQASTLEYEYALRFQGVESELSKALCFLLTDGGMDSDFSLTDGPAAHLRLIVDNINRIKGTTDWRIGSVIAADYKAVTYDGIDCLTALNRIAETFETEWWIVGTTLYLGKCEHGEPLELGYAADGTAVGGLLNMSKREEENGRFFTRLYAKGSTRNIDRSRYGSDYLRLPSPLKYLERNTEYGIVEREVIFDDVYPRRVGTLSGVRSIERESEGQAIRVYYIADKDMPFDPNDHEIAGLAKHVAFQTGELSGYDFEVNYDSSTGEFELINQYPDENTQIPDGVMVPKAGDTYILYNIRMPDEYYTLAEIELRETSEACLAKHSVDSSVYSGDSDPIILRRRKAVISLGQRVRLHNPVFFKSGYKDSRIIGFTRNICDPYDVRVDISDTVTPSWRESMERKVDSFLPILSQAGGSINIIKSGDDTVPTDDNVLSALKAISTFLRKDRPDQTRHLIKLLGGLISDNIESQDFASGPFGTGFIVKRDPKTGKSYIEVDEIYIRLKAYFDTLEIKHLSHVGGRIVLSPAGMECIKVEEVAAEYEDLYDGAGSPLYDSGNDRLRVAMDGGEKAYRCYFKQTDGERGIVNEFAVDDQAQCREFNVKTGVSHDVGNRYYWRRVIHVGDDHIDLSITDCDTGSMIPKAGDTIVAIGNRTDINRQHVVFLSSYDEDAPCIKLYSGINSYSMLNKEVTVISPNADKNVFTGKMVIKPGSTGFENLVDAPDMGEINGAIQDARDVASAAQGAIEGVRGSVDDFKSYVDGAFSDGIISEAETKGIARYANIVNNERASALATYNELENNPYLDGSGLVSLKNAKVSLFSSIDSLIDAINAAIEDKIASKEEIADINSKYSVFNTACATFYTSVEAANKSIQDKLRSFSTKAEKEAQKANNAVSAVAEDLGDTKIAVSDLDDYLDMANEDGIITGIEATTIGKYINTVNQSKKEMDATYTALYINPFLAGTAKTDLYSSKKGLDTATSNLIAAIQAAIADGKTTTEEKNNVDSKFTAFNNAYASLATAIENANKSIQQKIKEAAVNESKSNANSQIGTVSTAMKEEIAKQLGYGSYSDFEAAAKRGESITEGGSINTRLINAELMITSALIAKVIKTNELNVNDRFKIYTDGSVDVSGVLHSLGPKTELVISNGYLRISYDGEEVMRFAVNQNTGMPELNMHKGDRSVFVSPEKMIFGFGNGNRFLSLNPENIGDGAIASRDDGTLFVSNSTTNIITVGIYVSPAAGGTTTPSPSALIMRQGGETEYVEAFPNAGYEFDRWSDGGAKRHLVTWDVAGKGLTAYFTKISVQRYTVTLNASPSVGGTVSGGGTYDKGTVRTVSATPGTGYRFIRWSDGKNQSHGVTWDGNKTLTAYFEKAVITGEEILVGTDFNSNLYVSTIKTGSGTLTANASGGKLTVASSADMQGWVLFDKMYLGSKLLQGHKYRLSIMAKVSSGTTTFIAGIGYLSPEGDFNDLSSGDMIYGEQITTTAKTFTVDITAFNRSSSMADSVCVAFLPESSVTITIIGISLKEV